MTDCELRLPTFGVLPYSFSVSLKKKIQNNSPPLPLLSLSCGYTFMADSTIELVW